MAIYEFMKDPENTIFITSSKNPMDMPIYREYHKNIYTQSSNNIQGRRFKRAVIDEYFHFKLKNRQRWHEDLKILGVEEYRIFSSPEKIYDTKLFEFVNKVKAGWYKNPRMATNELISKITNNPDIEKLVVEAIDNLMCNFLTDVDVDIIDTPIFHSKNMKTEENRKRYELYFEDAADMEIDGIYVKDNQLYKDIIRRGFKPEDIMRTIIMMKN